ncbi:hypothetical protein ACHHYP_20526 [Achlya hypogyna]|uniref:Ankyrin repeat protein n=1 Tax=Achlya hypogyna TaxID=1202772 RepID=A0A1V9YJR4_ACHHY|nr:hypothetical protein ACHHYP_20526 [Achlya hypogyna]
MERSPASRWIPPYESLKWALPASLGHLHILSYLLEHHSVTYTHKAMAAAAQSGRVSAVRFLHERGFSIDDVLHNACTSGQLAVAQYAHAVGPRLLDPENTVIRTAHCGHLSLLQFLADSGYEVVSSTTLIYAATRGHLDVVKFLHERDTKGCPPPGRGSAAAYMCCTVSYLLEQIVTETFRPSVAVAQFLLDQHREHVDLVRVIRGCKKGRKTKTRTAECDLILAYVLQLRGSFAPSRTTTCTLQ